MTWSMTANVAASAAVAMISMVSMVSMVSMIGLSGCGPKVADEPNGDPGMETGPCIENQCLGGLQCLSDLCVGEPTGGDDGGDDGGDGGTVDDSTGGPPPAVSSAAILVVLDNSGSMGEEQARLPAALTALTEDLTASGIDWRLGVTTTDNGNPWCQGTGPEAGSLVASSCRSHTQDFVFNGATVIDATDEACLNLCPEEWANIALTDPWIDSSGGTTNLPAGLSLGDAMGCLVPQGISGCGFEETLESAYKSFARSETEGEASFGFFGAGTLPIVLIVSDEADCSSNKDHEVIFLPEGNRVFWSNPDDGAPTSAVCWNAGVTCSGGSCSSADKDVDGNPAANPETDAVLRPVSRYLDQFAGGLVFLIAGAASDGSVVYQDAVGDPGFQTDFGIGPGCESASGRAVPPVRMREVAEALAPGGQNIFSVCDGDYTAAATAIANAIEQRVPPG